MSTPREKWEAWQRERARTGRYPTGGSKMPLVDYIVEDARWSASAAVADDVRGKPVNPLDLERLDACVSDLRALLRERRTP